MTLLLFTAAVTAAYWITYGLYVLDKNDLEEQGLPLDRTDL